MHRNSTTGGNKNKSPRGNPKNIEQCIKKFLKEIGIDYETYKRNGILELKGLPIQEIPSEFNQCVFLNRLIVGNCSSLRSIHLNNPRLYGVLIVSNRNFETIRIGGDSKIQKFFVYSNNPSGIGYIVEDLGVWRDLKILEVDSYRDYVGIGSPSVLESVHFINESPYNLVNIHRVGCKTIDISFDRGDRSNYTTYNPNSNISVKTSSEFENFWIGESQVNFWLNTMGFDYKKILEIFKNIN